MHTPMSGSEPFDTFQASPSLFTINGTTTEHYDGGANCFITNSKEHFIQYTPCSLQVHQLDGSIATAEGFGLKLIQWPT